MALNSFLTCPADCDTALVLGATDTNQDCTSYKQRYSQLYSLVIQPDAASAPLDWTSAPAVTEVANEIDNSDTTGNKSKRLVGEGEVPVPEKVTDEYPGRKNRTSFRTYTLTHTIKNLSDEQYDLLRQLQCGYTGFKIWYDTVGGWIYGGANGIDISSIDVDFPKGGGRDDKELAVITITWEADGDPARGNSPFAMA